MLSLFFENDFVNLIGTPPGSMLFVLLLSTITTIITTILTKWLVNTDEINRKQALIKAHEEEKQKIIDLAEIDPERYRKARKRWERKDIMVKKTQQRMSLQRMKPSCVTFVPMIIIFFVLNQVVFRGAQVALSPMHANDVPLIGNFISADAIWINFTAWYFICSLGINTLIQRLLKIQSQASGGMGGMFAGQKAKALEFPDV
ncbi:MAG: EMC3/TMCO1 family protein [Candidatus Odinarchaeota archaeon]